MLEGITKNNFDVKRVSHRLGSFALLLIFAWLVTSCGPQKTVVDFVFMRTSDATQPYWQGVISDFQAANPDIQVNLHVFTAHRSWRVSRRAGFRNTSRRDWSNRWTSI
jgi:hypothetical protein